MKHKTRSAGGELGRTVLQTVAQKLTYQFLVVTLEFNTVPLNVLVYRET